MPALIDASDSVAARSLKMLGRRTIILRAACICSFSSDLGRQRACGVDVSVPIFPDANRRMSHIRSFR